MRDPDKQRETLRKAAEARRKAPLEGRRAVMHEFSKEIAIVLGLALMVLVYLVQR